ncbi:zinc-binding alcohol dehydrogenase family protein [Pendulispora albinea]|uniref:NADPH:quinone oxidoreductase family protein n=1 Tax=Pendulispora albinea TaxID=2741071 RepID=A0ABZ2LSK9_9BACT
MKAIRIHRFGPPDVLQLEDVPDPRPAPGRILIRVRAAGMNYADLLIREGRYPKLAALPYTPGYEAAGVVEALGEGVEGPAVGTRVVAAVSAPGTFAEYVEAEPAQVTEIPEGVGDEEALALPVQALTAWLALRIGGRVAPGDSVLIPAAAGGAGHLAVQLAKRLGAARVLAGASTKEKRDLALRLGADAAIDYTEGGWADQVRAATDGRGADVVFERSGGAHADESLRALAKGGRLIVFGADSLTEPRLSTEQLRGLLVQGQAYAGFSLMALPDGVRRAALHELFAFVAAGALQVHVGARFPLARAADAHRAMASRATSGKVVINL